MAELNSAKADPLKLKRAADAKRVQLEDLIARAAAKDAIKDFNAAAELYSQATELQAELNGELSLDNADLLFAYGKALYNVAVSKSDVLGSKVAGEPQAQTNDLPASGSKSSAHVPGESVIKNAIASGVAKQEHSKDSKSSPGKTLNQPFFQFSGDENFDESESEAEEGDGGADGVDDDDDDFANAFEVLDLARILYHKKLAAVEESCEKGKSAGLLSDVKHIKERLADTYDLQAEISLEGERFTDAVADLRTALDLRQSLFSMEDPSLAECHYKLSLALEFASVNNPGEGTTGGDSERRGKVDKAMREEAATQMEKAIESCRVRMAQEQKKLDVSDALDEDRETALRRKIANVKEIIEDMEQRLLDLRRPPVSVEQQNEESDTMLRGILGQIVGQPAVEQQARLEAITKDAKDLSAFVKRKPAGIQHPPRSESTEKRSAPEQVEDEFNTKKARTESAENV
ncbi:SHNi-TPR domain-containing protein [Aspergillus novofumigatus IBT 16806]|uniref:Tetratricopeptide repeat domain protein n=1 Tax=Aspergillus novofumigatus (strain IBT 16806) TaxID=1392255 RepID=A0A2I1CLQ9_ASPN1|nr:tetratricopeptide repeat domain protein [Aspergillus novofumigatus IBT 16806]PKX98552.1 tetratricopeptide repeat domain protein [Aspergillus novofumigatus IBT 16806]